MGGGEEEVCGASNILMTTTLNHGVISHISQLQFVGQSIRAPDSLPAPSHACFNATSLRRYTAPELLL